MSGPVTQSDTSTIPESDAPSECDVVVLEGRRAEVGGFGVRRLLPRRERRTVGAWCFVDHMGPGSLEAEALDVGPHPHIGLQTVTWLFEGELLHRDSLGSEQLIRPGQLNLMTAGRGVSHSEETSATAASSLHGIQLWIAQPNVTRDGAPAFEHHAELPVVELDNATATVIVGGFDGALSPARRDTDHVGVAIDVRPGRTVIPLDAAHEHALVVAEGAASVGPLPLEPGRLAYLGLGRDEIAVDVGTDARVLLIGGAPFHEPILMWWNYVARTREEIVEAHRAWTAHDERFGTVASPVPRIDTGGPPW